MSGAADIWKKIADRYKLAEKNVGRLASWWHTDADLGRQLECLNDMTNSRTRGFTDYQPTAQSFLNLFERLKQEKIVPG